MRAASTGQLDGRGIAPTSLAVVVDGSIYVDFAKYPVDVPPVITEFDPQLSRRPATSSGCHVGMPLRCRWKSSQFVYLIWLILSLILFSGAASAQTCITPPSGMIAWWTLDETSGIVAKDSVGTEPAAYFGSPPPVQTPGLVAGALNFNGFTDFLSAAQSNLWAFGTEDFTIEFWVNFASSPGGSTGHPADIFIGNDEGPGDQNKWFFAIGGSNLEFHINSPTLGPQFFPLAPFSPTVNQWYHLAITRSGSTYTIYINGVPSGSAVNTNAIPTANAPLTIGQAESLGFMNGLLDEVTVYNRALTETELQSIFSAGAAGKCKTATSTTRSISPSTGGDTGQVSVNIVGSGFASGSSVQLSRSGLAGILGTNVRASPDGTILSATFDLTNRPRGIWDVVITTPGSSPITLPAAFTIIAGGSAQVWADIVGRGAIRVGQPFQFILLFGNRGNIDAVGNHIWIRGIPIQATVSTDFSYTVSVNDTSVQPPPIVETHTDKLMPLYIPVIPPGYTGALPFNITMPSTGSFELKAMVFAP